MGPHPKKLVVRTFESRPGSYAEKVKAKIATQIEPLPAEKPVERPPKVRVPGPGADRKPGLSVAEQRQRKRARLDALTWLKATFPVLFDAYPPRPLAIGIGKLIAPIAREAGVPRQDLGAALHYHVHRHAYLAALTADNAMRFDLRGEPAGPVEPEHQAEARKLLAVIAGIKARRAAPVNREGVETASPTL